MREVPREFETVLLRIQGRNEINGEWRECIVLSRYELKTYPLESFGWVAGYGGWFAVPDNERPRLEVRVVAWVGFEEPSTNEISMLLYKRQRELKNKIKLAAISKLTTNEIAALDIRIE